LAAAGGISAGEFGVDLSQLGHDRVDAREQVRRHGASLPRLAVRIQVATPPGGGRRLGRLRLLALLPLG
jgi:hypothetical protein